MPNRYLERKRIVRDDEDGPVTSHSPMIKREASSNGIHSPQQQQAQQALRGATPKPGMMGVRAYPLQKPFYAAESPESLLAKYANETPSLILHIHHTHFRFGNQESVIPKNSPLMKAFLECVAQKVIPPAAVEVFGDMAIHFYEGCIILRILDHRNLTSEGQSGQSSTTSQNATPGPDGAEIKNKNLKLAEGSSLSKSNSSNNNSNGASEPKVYTTILRPSPLSMWHDLLYATDGSHGLFPDQLAINIEAELLKFTVRNVDLRVPENSLLAVSKYKTTLKPAPKFAPGSLKKAEAHKALFTYRPEVSRKRRGLHEDSLHHGSEYEQLMLIMDEKPAQNSGQFMRLSFIEGWRKKQKIRMMQQKAQQPSQPGQQPGQHPPNANNINNNANLSSHHQPVQQGQQFPFSQTSTQRQGSPLTQQSPQNIQFNRQQVGSNQMPNSSNNNNFANGVGNNNNNNNGTMNNMGNLNNMNSMGTMNNIGGLNNVGLNNNNSSNVNGANPGNFGNINNIGNMNLNMGMGIGMGTIPMTNNNNNNNIYNNNNGNNNSNTKNANYNTNTMNGNVANNSITMSVSSSPQSQNAQLPGSTMPKTRGKGSRPRGKTGLTRGGGSTRGRGKAGSKASSSDNHMSQGGKTVPGSGGSGTSSAGLSSPVFGLGSVTTPQSQWDTSGIMLGGNSMGNSSVGGKTLLGKTVPGKTVPGKTVPGKTVPGKTVPGKTVPGKTVPGKTVPGSTTKGRPKTKKESKK
jgi:transcription factor SPT20